MRILNKLCTLAALTGATLGSVGGCPNDGALPFQEVLFSSIPAGSYDGNVRAISVSYFNGEGLIIFDGEIYHSINFDATGYPMGYDKSGNLERLVVGRTENIGGVIYRIRKIGAPENKVIILSDVANALGYTGKSGVSYRLQPDGTLSYDAVLRIFEDETQQNGQATLHSGKLRRN